MFKSVSAVLLFVLLFTLAPSEEAGVPWRNIENLKPPNGHVTYLALDGLADVVCIKSFKDGLLTYLTFGPNFDIRENTEPIYKFKRIVFDSKTRMDMKKVMAHVLEYYEDSVLSANNDHQIDFLKGFSEFLIRTGSLKDFFFEWTGFYARIETLPERMKKLRPEQSAKLIQDIIMQHRFYSSFILFVVCSIDYETFKEVSAVVSKQEGMAYNRIKKFVADLDTRKDELARFINSLMQENKEFSALVRKVRDDVSGWTPEKFDYFLKLPSRQGRDKPPERTRGERNGGPNRFTPGPNN